MEMHMTPEAKAARAREKFLNKLESVAWKVAVLSKEIISVEIAGCTLSGNVCAVNAQLERLGCRPVRITSNMLNPDSKLFAIDINTPSYCDPGCESYHSA